MALAPVAYSDYTENSFYEFYKKYWRSFKGHCLTELWGRGYEDRLADNAGRETTKMVEDAFWDAYQTDEQADDPDRAQAYMGHFPHGGASAQILDHIGQMYNESKL